MKKCIKCQELKVYEEYHFDKNSDDGRQKVCKPCRNLWYKDNYEKNKQVYLDKNDKRRNDWRDFISSLKSGGCCKCEETEICTLDFHHHGDKDFDVSKINAQSFNQKNRDRVIEEINKCILVCSNCHRKIHAGIIRY